jgi:S-adenosyl methyltransferase
MARHGASAADEGEIPSTFDTSVAHIARVYNYWLGGKDNFAADRAAAQHGLAIYPNVALSARANRAFLRRAVTFLVREAGIRQFLDIGTGIPTANNTHEVAQALAPESQIVYVDNDPVVLAHARALLTSSPAGVTDYLDADLRDTERILAAAAGTLDFGKPVAVMLIAIMHLLADDDDPYGVVRKLMTAVPHGSYLALSHPASDIEVERQGAMTTQLNTLLAEKVTIRNHGEVARFFDGLELLEPGIVNAPQWRPDNDLERASPAAIWAGVARRP